MNTSIKVMGVDAVIDGQDAIQQGDMVSGENGLVGTVESVILSQDEVKAYRVRSKSDDQLYPSPAKNTKLLAKSTHWWKSLNAHLKSGEIVDLEDTESAAEGYAKSSRTYKADEEEVGDNWYEIFPQEYASVRIKDPAVLKMAKSKEFTDKIVLDGMYFHFAYVTSLVSGLSGYKDPNSKKLLALAMDLKDQHFDAVFFYPV